NGKEGGTEGEPTAIGYVQQVVTDGVNDVLAAGRLDARGGFVVLKLAGADGSDIWSASAGPNGDFAWAVAVDAAGDVVAAGGIDTAEQKFAVLRLRGTDGAEGWRS